MRLIGAAAFVFGFFIPIVMDFQPRILSVSLVICVWVFFGGYTTNAIIYRFFSPFFTNRIDSNLFLGYTKNLNIFRNLIAIIGIAYLVSDLIFHMAIGTLPLAIIIYSIGIHVGTNYCGKEQLF